MKDYGRGKVINFTKVSNILFYDSYHEIDFDKGGVQKVLLRSVFGGRVRESHAL